MRNRIDIDLRTQPGHRSGDRQETLRASLKPEPELPARLKTQIDRLRKLEGALIVNRSRCGALEKTSPLNRWVGPTWTSYAVGETPCVKDFERVR